MSTDSSSSYGDNNDDISRVLFGKYLRPNSEYCAVHFLRTVKEAAPSASFTKLEDATALTFGFISGLVLSVIVEHKQFLDQFLLATDVDLIDRLQQSIRADIHDELYHTNGEPISPGTYVDFVHADLRFFHDSLVVDHYFFIGKGVGVSVYWTIRYPIKDLLNLN